MVAIPQYKDVFNQKIIVAPTAGTQFNIHRGTGFDTSTDIYLNFGPNARKISLTSNVGFLITKFGGKVLDYPIKVHANKLFTDSRISHNIGAMKIHTLGGTTYIRILVGGFA